MDSILSGSKKKNKKKRNVVPLPNLNDFISDNSENEDKKFKENSGTISETEDNNKEDIITNENNSNTPTDADNNNDDEIPKDSIKESPQPKKLKGKKAKEARLKARKEKKALAETRCRVCNEQFNSKNVLFNHIKETGHSLALPEEIETKSKKKNKKRR